jgi:hypothetical protein
MKLWESYFRLWKGLGDCLTKGSKESQLLKEKSVEKVGQVKLSPKRELYCDCGDGCLENFGM